MRAIGLGNVGARRMLTAEELAHKTLALTGFQWGRSRGFQSRPEVAGRSHLTNAERGYALLYGGIDSDGVTERARHLTSVMAGVAQSHALQSSHPIIMREFCTCCRTRTRRRLFAGCGHQMLARHSNSADTFADYCGFLGQERERVSLTLHGRLELWVGSHGSALTFLNDFSQSEPARNRIAIFDLTGLDVLNAHRRVSWSATIELEDSFRGTTGQRL